MRNMNAAYEFREPADGEPSRVVDVATGPRTLRLPTKRPQIDDAVAATFVADSAPMRRLVDEVKRVASKDVTVLVRGETGTGKEHIASLLHAHSRRASGAFVRVNCAAIPHELAEAELFGHVRGAFTGAVQAHRGFFAEADGGTLVLDEIGELPLALQPKLLRVLQDGEIQPVGSGRVEQVDVRVVASTNRDLQAEARDGLFREDLYYRLAVVELVVPPLRAHRDDVPALATEFARRYSARFGIPSVRLSPALLAKLREADWPGNVRQLENAVARIVALAPSADIGPDAFVAEPKVPMTSREATNDAPAAALPSTTGLSLREQIEAVERSLIISMLAVTAGSGRCRSRIPEHADHRFRSKPITDSGASRSLNA